MPNKIYGKTCSQFRIDDDLYAKLKYIAKIKDRPMNSQLERFIRQGVERFESENGEIILPPEYDSEP